MEQLAKCHACRREFLLKDAHECSTPVEENDVMWGLCQSCGDKIVKGIDFMEQGRSGTVTASDGSTVTVKSKQRPS